ncbi:MAG: threonine synthase [Terriglobales bacterium]
MSLLTHLECTRCHQSLPADRPQTVCPTDGGSLYARYDMARVGTALSPEILRTRHDGAAASMWKYREIMPATSPLTLGEGQTPLLPTRRLGASMGATNLWVKDEGLNPTGSFKARGLGCAVSMLHQFGVKKIAIPTAGNAGSALAAYCALAGIEAHIFAPADVPRANLAEYRYYGATINLVDGLISDCALRVQEGREREGWFDISTMKEPYRVEGKKTMAYEVVEQMGWKVPDVLFYPTGGGVGLIGMWKAFEEMEALGWIGEKRPRMVAVQASGCAPVVTAFDLGKPTCERPAHPVTLAAGLRVPKPYADYLVLDILRQSHGTAEAVNDDDIKTGVRELAAMEGIFAAPEGGAAIIAARRLYQRGWIQPHETVVIYNTGTALKYLDELG